MKFNSLLEAVAHYSEHTPDKVCLIDADNDRSITYAGFWKAICIFANRIKESGLQNGERVVVRVGPLIETFVAQFAINLAGGVYCPLEKHLKPLKIKEMLNYYEANILVSTENIDFDGTWIDLFSACNDGESLDKYCYPKPEDICAIIFTTGTTGKAKGVIISNKAYTISSQLRCKAYAVGEDDVYYWVTPLDRASCSKRFGIVVTAGCTAVHSDGIMFVNSYLQNISKYGVTVIFLQSYALNIVIAAKANAFCEFNKQIRSMSFGGGNMPEKLKQHLCTELPDTRLFTMYSSTEATGIACYDFSRYPGKTNCVGKPLPGGNVSFIDYDGKVMDDTSKNNPGIVVYEGSCGMAGYWKDDELTAKTIVKNKIIMTDMGYRDNDGFIYLVGRRDDVIVSGGNKIAPYEIEDVVLQMPGISECVCISHPNETAGAVPKLFVVMNKDAEFSAKEIYNYLAVRLETFKLPRIIRELESFPRIAKNSKIDRRALSEYD